MILIYWLQVLDSHSDGLCVYILDMLCAKNGVCENSGHEIALSGIRETQTGSIYSTMLFTEMIINHYSKYLRITKLVFYQSKIKFKTIVTVMIKTVASCK